MKPVLTSIIVLLFALTSRPTIGAEVSIRNCSLDTLVVCAFNNNDLLKSVPYQFEVLASTEGSEMQCVGQRCEIWAGAASEEVLGAMTNLCVMGYYPDDYEDLASQIADEINMAAVTPIETVKGLNEDFQACVCDASRLFSGDAIHLEDAAIFDEGVLIKGMDECP